MSKRFIVDNKNIQINGENVVVNSLEVHHINVLRYKIGDNVYINDYEINITKLSKNELEGKIVGKLPKKGIPKVSITLIQSYLKSDKMDYVVQKAVELGAKSIIPVITKNTVVKLEDKDKIKKLERLNKIAKEAVEQCGRADEVSICKIQNLNSIDYNNYDLVFICHETSDNSVKQVLKEVNEVNSIAFIVGPEGGLDDKELETILKLKNVKVVSLGERILRAETASLKVLSILDYEFN